MKNTRAIIETDITDIKLILKKRNTKYFVEQAMIGDEITTIE
jgi:hypothetical protein